ncbi:uncharacterized protein CLUP02_03099 [Colletotrichum lupini]|uniref:Uncharacterized protein n=1 Tax=Colletotrichum lupini TaxID=145971 RepID=A0A9Q8WCI8_9PEZI|nr:uncharacterized protein CLUP02_03099 [Colletotrichum lupini]UQC77630.1 hypothetical protein CLUP02_03099 [Colletotrichum lupini]
MALANAKKEAKAGGVSEKDKKPGGPTSTQPIINKASFSGHVRFWIVYLFIDLPSEKVSTTCGILGDKEPSYWTTYIHVIVGFMVSPVLLVARLIQIFLYNTIDLGRLAWGQYKLFVTSAKPKKQQLKRNWLTDTTSIHRSLKEKVAEVKERLSDQQISKNEPSSTAHFSYIPVNVKSIRLAPSFDVTTVSQNTVQEHPARLV